MVHVQDYLYWWSDLTHLCFEILKEKVVTIFSLKSSFSVNFHSKIGLISLNWFFSFPFTLFRYVPWGDICQHIFLIFLSLMNIFQAGKCSRNAFKLFGEHYFLIFKLILRKTDFKQLICVIATIFDKSPSGYLHRNSQMNSRRKHLQADYLKTSTLI